MCEELKPDILCFSETWLNHYIDDSDIHLNGYTLVRNDRKSINSTGSITRGGGVCIYVHMKYKFEVLDARWNISSKDLETLTIKLIIKGTRPIFVASVYRPPSGIVKVRLRWFGTDLVKLEYLCYLLRDVNVLYIK